MGLTIVLSIAFLFALTVLYFNVRVKKNIGLELQNLAIGEKVIKIFDGRWYLFLSSSRCHQCSVMKDRLIDGKVNFQELPIEENLKAVKALNIMGTPTTFVMLGNIVENIKTGIFKI